MASCTGQRLNASLRSCRARPASGWLPSMQLPCNQGAGLTIPCQTTGRLLLCKPRAAVTAEKAQLDISKMEPLHDRLLIKPYEEEPKTAAGILLPKPPPKTNSDAHFGTVVAKGEDVTLDVSPGDWVIFNKYAMAEVEVAEGEILFVSEKSVLGKLE